ncbi:MAG: hypothetical protein HGA31_04640 [Candidatus Moranbacteria bacterium]|nr:hypothetical protein [Candidatus Moranbacteria bacterium]
MGIIHRIGAGANLDFRNRQLMMTSRSNVTIIIIFMKRRLLIGISGIIIVAGGAAWYLFLRPQTGRIPGVIRKESLTAWNYERTIAEPITGISGADKDLVLGDIDTNKASVSVPKGSFDADRDLSLVTPESVPGYVGNEIDTIGAPLEVSAGQPSRLNEQATVSFRFDPSTLPVDQDTSELRVAYYDGTKWEYIKPISIDKEDGLVTFGTYHFSLFGLTKIKDDTVITEKWIHSQTVDGQIRDGLNNVSDEVSGKIVDLMLQKMGISDESVKGKVLAEMLKNDAYKDIHDSYTSGDMTDMSQKIAVLAGSKIAELVPESAWQEGLKNLTEGTDTVEAVSKAAGYAAEGQYKDAAKIIGEKIADQFLITTAGKIAVEVVQGKIDSWKNDEVEAAYYAYQKGANATFYGYNVDPGDFNSVWDQMRGIRRQLELEAVNRENGVRAEAGLPPLSDRQADAIRDGIKESYRKQFTLRAEKEKAFEEEAARLRLLVDAYKKADFFDSTLGPTGLDKGLDYENKLDVLYHFAQKMMKDTGRFQLSEKNGLLMDKAVAVDDVVQGARMWFSGPEGRKKYAAFLKDRFGIDLFPTLSNLSGSWPNGKMKITDVIVPEAMKEKPKEGGSSENDPGCDFSMDLSQLIGKEMPMVLSIKPSGNAGGTMTFGSSDSEPKEVPFTYVDGVITSSFNEKGAVGSLTLTVSEENGSYVASGPFIITFKNDKGEAKIIASVSASKPVPKPGTSASMEQK